MTQDQPMTREELEREERKIHEALTNAWADYMALPSPTNAERIEFTRTINSAQDQIAARAGRRVLFEA